MGDLVKKEKRTLKEYAFSAPEPAEGGMLKVTATHSGQTVGTLTFAAKPTVRPNHSYDGYHKIGKADVHPYHRGNGVYGKMLQVAAKHVKAMGSRGLVSPGEWREDKATKAWERLASKVPAVKKRPGLDPDNPDFFLSESENVEPLGSESSPDNVEHEWFVEFMRWLSERQDLKKSWGWDEDMLSEPQEYFNPLEHEWVHEQPVSVPTHTLFSFTEDPKDRAQCGVTRHIPRGQMRGKPENCDLHIKGIADSLKAGQKIPPLLLEQRQDGTYRVSDGNHRLQAAKSLGLPHVPAMVMKRKDASSFGKTEDFSNLLGRNLPKAHSRADEEIAVQMSGISHHLSPEFKAARFLANGKTVSEDQIRNSLVLYDHNFELAALHAYGLPRNRQFVEMLRATMKMGTSELSKADLDVAALPRHFEAILPDGKEVATALQRAQSSGTIKSVKLGGKHSKGTAIAVDPKTKKRWLLKPGSGQLSPARGVRQERASQSRREVAFYKVAELAGIAEAFPEAYLMKVDGNEVAVMELLDTDYQSLDKAKRKLGVDPRPLFEPHRKDGTLYRWAALDWIFGNADRHANNIMVKDKKIKLIDHGTTFAGPDFNPSLDLKKSFIPYYLRAWSHFNFTTLEPRDRAAQMPTMDHQRVHEFGHWVEDLSGDKLRQVMELYGINPEPSLMRLRDLKSAKPELRAQRLIGLWAGTLRPQSEA
jgi:hypothetical protein